MKELIRKIFTHNLARGSAIVFAGSMTANVAAYVYHLLMGRLLGPTGYGELSSLMSILYIFTAPLIVLQTVLVKLVSGFKAHGEVGQAKSLFVKMTKLGAIVGVAGIPVVYLTAGQVTTFLHLTQPALFFLVYALFVLSLVTVVAISVLQGYQKFAWMSTIAAGAILLKIVLSVPLASAGVYGVVWAAFIASFVVYAIGFLPLRFMLRVSGKPTNLNRKDALGYAIPTLLTIIGVTSLFSTDIILVRHYFTSAQAGEYAAIAILGKVIFYASSAVTMVLFPVLSERVALGAATQKLIWWGTGAVAAVSAGLTTLYFLFPELIVGLLFGNAYAHAGELLGLFGVFLALYSVGYVVTMAALALGHTKVWIPALVMAALQIVAINFAHDTLRTVIQLNIGVSLLFVLWVMAYYLATSHEKV
jgi:O-antigen/teichoic acid export membrane protein